MPCEIVAEIGVNHNGDIQEAHRLVTAAKRCGADTVKFQLFDSHKLWGDDRIERYQFTIKHMQMLKEHAESLGVEFLCTPFDVDSLWALVGIGVKRLKISSGCLRHEKLIDAAIESNLPVILSTGMSTQDEVEYALMALGPEITLLQCTSCYPAPIGQINLNVMKEWLSEGLKAGLSDHTKSIYIPVAAVSMGAVMIEKHFTLRDNQEGPDHKASMMPAPFGEMVRAIREVESAMGHRMKSVQPCENKLREVWNDSRV